jgi:hypothetical protein
VFRIFNRLREEERGIALVIALGLTIVLSISVTTSIYYASTNVRSAGRSTADMKALSLAEAGMNNAVAILNGANTAALSSSALPNACCTATQAYGNDAAYWWGTLVGNKWTVYGKGVVKNPGAADVVRQVHVDVSVLASPTQSYNAQAWEYVMSTGVAGNTTNCDQQLSGGGQGGNAVVINTRLYVFGNLCIGVAGQGQAVLTAANIQVRGRVMVNNGSIGTTSLYVNGLHIGGGCVYGGTYHATCSTADHVYSNPVPDTTVDMSVTAPTADFTTSATGYYNNASPGPKFPCTTSTGTVPVFESASNTAVDNSVPGYFELTPSGATSDYSCKTSLGEISWNHTSRTLTVIGTIFIDGSAKITNTTGVINYAGPSSNNMEGDASLYLTGTFLMASGTKFCAKVLVNATDCDWAGWIPNNELFGIVTHGSGGQNPAGVGTWINNASFQGGLFSDNKIRIEQQATTQGPMVGSEVQLGYGLSSGTQTNYGFPLINTIPSGFPGVPNTHAQPQPPTAFSG